MFEVVFHDGDGDLIVLSAAIPTQTNFFLPPGIISGVLHPLWLLHPGGFHIFHFIVFFILSPTNSQVNRV
jgi:hypothetical protein